MKDIRGRLKKLENLLPAPRGTGEGKEAILNRLLGKLKVIGDRLREFPRPRSKMSIAERLATAETPEEFAEVREAIKALGYFSRPEGEG